MGREARSDERTNVFAVLGFALSLLPKLPLPVVKSGKRNFDQLTEFFN